MRSRTTQWRTFWMARAGVTAVEFALIAPAFFAMMFGIVESSIMYYLATSMEGEVQVAARQIRTGVVQGSADPVDAFQDLLCTNLSGLMDCEAVVIDVRTFPDFGAFDRPRLIDDDGNPQNESFDPGSAGDVVLVRIAYRYNIVTPMLSHLFYGGGDGFVDLYAAAAFQNEPY